jgi:hypothetical protein
MTVWAVGAVAEGLGIRTVARIFALDPNTVRHWVTEVADQAAAFSRSFLHDVQSTQVQLDEFFALLSAMKAGDVTRGSPHPLVPCFPLGVGRAGSRHQAGAGSRGRRAHAGDGPTTSPSGSAGVSARLCPFVSHRWVQGVSAGHTHALWALGPTTSVRGHRPAAQTPLAAASPVAVHSDDQDDSPAPVGGG